MQKKILLLVLLLVNFFLIVNAQEDKEIGTLYYNNSKDTSTIYFTKEFNQFKNKYEIYRYKNDKDPLCSIVLEYDKDLQEININIKDKGIYRNKSIKFDSNAEACIVKNYKTFDTVISLNDKYEILFTFQDVTKKEKIILNQISSIDNSVTYKLTPLRNSYLNNHLKASRAYWDIYRKNKKTINDLNKKLIDDLYKSKNIPITEGVYNVLGFMDHVLTNNELEGIRAKITVMALPEIEAVNKKKIESLIAEIDLSDSSLKTELYNSIKGLDHGLTEPEIALKRTKYKRFVAIDSLKSVIRREYKEALKQLKENEESKLKIQKPADEIAESKLKINLDNIFYEQYKDIREVINGFQLSLTIYTDTAGKITWIDPPITNLPPTSYYYTSLMRPYKTKLEEEIYKMKLEARKDILTQSDYYSKFLEKYYSGCHNLDPSMTFFTELLDSIEKKFNTKKELNFPTVYEYKFEYSSSIRLEQWKIVGDNQFYNKNKLYNVDEEEKRLFLNKYPHPKRGKYDVKFFDAKSGVKSFPEKLYSAERRYRFMSHIGFNIDLIPNKDIPINGTIFDFYFTKHHLGLFLGFANDGNGKSLYNDGGLYLSPSNYLYFKLGFAKLDDHFNLGGILGISLILPFIQFEGGYNTALHSVYFGGGLNIPFFR